MVPVIQSMSQSQGVDLSVLAWALSIGTDLGGSATPIGASANVVGTSVAAKNWPPGDMGYLLQVLRPGHGAGHHHCHGLPLRAVSII